MPCPLIDDLLISIRVSVQVWERYFFMLAALDCTSFLFPFRFIEWQLHYLCWRMLAVVFDGNLHSHVCAGFIVGLL